jgi:hypothetical protein
MREGEVGRVWGRGAYMRWVMVDCNACELPLIVCWARWGWVRTWQLVRGGEHCILMLDLVIVLRLRIVPQSR